MTEHRPAPPPPPDEPYQLNPGPPVWVSMIGVVAWICFVMWMAYLIVTGSR